MWPQARPPSSMRARVGCSNRSRRTGFSLGDDALRADQLPADHGAELVDADDGDLDGPGAIALRAMELVVDDAEGIADGLIGEVRGETVEDNAAVGRLIMRSSVDLAAPERPRKPSICPGGRSDCRHRRPFWRRSGGSDCAVRGAVRRRDGRKLNVATGWLNEVFATGGQAVRLHQSFTSSLGRTCEKASGLSRGMWG